MKHNRGVKFLLLLVPVLAAIGFWFRSPALGGSFLQGSRDRCREYLNGRSFTGRVRFSIPVGVSYDSNPEEVREVVLDVAKRHPDVLHDPAPEFLSLGFGDSSINFELRVWTIKQVQTPKVLSRIFTSQFSRSLGRKASRFPIPNVICT